MSEEPKVLGHINIIVTEDDLLYDTEFDVEAIIFWLRMAEHMILNNLTKPVEE